MLKNFDGLLRIRAKSIIQRIKTAIPEGVTDSVPKSIPAPEKEAVNASEIPGNDYDKSALWEKIPDEYKDHPILKDTTTLFSIFREKTGCGPIWSGRYRNELASAQLITIADFALLIITLGFEFAGNSRFGPCYAFMGGKPSLRTKEFGGWAWGVVLN
jgi:hypothetical protein